MKKLVVAVMAGIMFSSQVICADAATTQQHKGTMVTSGVESENLTAESEIGIRKSGKKPTLVYTATISNRTWLFQGVELYLSSSAKNKSTGKAVKVDEMKISGTIYGKDGTKRQNSKTAKNTSGTKLTVATNDYCRTTLKKCKGTHTFKKKGYKTKKISTEK